MHHAGKLRRAVARADPARQRPAPGHDGERQMIGCAADEREMKCEFFARFVAALAPLGRLDDVGNGRRIDAERRYPRFLWLEYCGVGGVRGEHAAVASLRPRRARELLQRMAESATQRGTRIFRQMHARFRLEFETIAGEGKIGYHAFTQCLSFSSRRVSSLPVTTSMLSAFASFFSESPSG